MPPKKSSGARAANLLGALSHVVADRLNASAEAAAPLGPSAPAALASLHEFMNGGTVTQLSAVLGLTHSGTVRLVDRMGGEGLVERGGAEDGRSVSVVLTSAGRRTAERVLQTRAAVLAELLEGLDSTEVERLAGLLEKVLATATLARAAERTSGTRSRPPAWLCRLCDFDACGRDQGRCPVRNAVPLDASPASGGRGAVPS